MFRQLALRRKDVTISGGSADKSSFFLKKTTDRRQELKASKHNRLRHDLLPRTESVRGRPIRDDIQITACGNAETDFSAES